MRVAQLGFLALTLVLARPAAAEAASAEAPVTHVVREGQTLYRIARDYKVSLDALCRANGLLRSQTIRPGKTLIVPGTKRAAASEARSTATPETRNAPPSSPRGAATPETRDAPAKPPRATAASETRSAAVAPAKNAKTAKTPKAAAKPAAPQDPYVRAPKRPGYLILRSTVGRWEGVAVTKNGKIPDSARAGFSRVMASWRTGERQAISDELLRMLVRVSDHFGGRPVRIVSGFRPWSKTQFTPHSQHNLGRAIDFSIPGVPNEVVRDFCRTFSKAGVGYYPNSSFVHLDARGYPSYWIDYSGPGRPPRYASAPTPPAGGGS